MRGKTVAVLDIRSADLTALIGERGVNNTFWIKGVSTISYVGYEGGVMLDEKVFCGSVINVVKRARLNANESLQKIFIGVPSDFLFVYKGAVSLPIPQRKKFTQKDAIAMLNDFVGQYSVEGYDVLSYTVDDVKFYNETSVSESYFPACNSVSAKVDSIYITKYFKQIVASALSNVDDFELEFIPQTSAEEWFLLPDEKKREQTLFMDFDIYSTELSYISGNELLFLHAIPLGEGDLLNRLSKKYQTQNEVFLHELIEKTNLFYVENEHLFATMPVTREGVFYSEVNEQIFSLIDQIVKSICDIDRECEREGVQPFKRIVISGYGLPQIKGFKEYLSKYIRLPVYEVEPPVPYYDKNISLSAYGLLDAAIQKQEKNINNISFKFFKKFGG